MKIKTCNDCNEEKLLTEFHSTGWYKKDGKRISKMYKPDCKVCANAKWKERYFARLAKVLESSGRRLECEHCHWDEHPVGLDFHHKDPNKKDFAISSRWTISEEKLEKEVEKCLVLCALCHRMHHAGVLELGP